MLVLKCDGCVTELPQEQALARGRVEQLFYCAACAAHADRLQADLDAERVRLTTAFEAFRAERVKDVRKALRKLPDD